jgi:hypothetical protein
MKFVHLLWVSLGLSWFLTWVRHDCPFPVRAALPFAGTGRPPLYDVAQLVLLAWTGFAARRLLQR